MLSLLAPKEELSADVLLVDATAWASRGKIENRRPIYKLTIKLMRRNAMLIHNDGLRRNVIRQENKIY